MSVSILWSVISPSLLLTLVRRENAWSPAQSADKTLFSEPVMERTCREGMASPQPVDGDNKTDSQAKLLSLQFSGFDVLQPIEGLAMLRWHY